MIPILVIAYNRPASLIRLIDSLCAQHHGKIFVHCDGARGEDDIGARHTQDIVRRLHSNKVIEQYYIQDFNLGLMDSVHFAADWFFEINEFGLILEDDLIINPPALQEAEFLRKEVAESDSARVFCLANPLPRKQIEKIAGSYWYSDFFVSYAWATSRENWKTSLRSIGGEDIMVMVRFAKSNFGWIVGHNFKQLLKRESILETRNRKKCSFAWRFTLDQVLKGNKILISRNNRIGYSGFGHQSTNTRELEIWGSDFGKYVDLGEYYWVKPQNKNPSAKLDRYFLRDYALLRSIAIKVASRTRIKGLFRWINMEGN